MNNNAVLICIILLSACVYICSAECEPFLSRPPECAALLVPNLLIESPNGNQSASAELLTQILPRINTLDPAKCGPVATSFACADHFRRCPTATSTSIQNGTRVCKSLCLSVLSSCASIFATYGALIPAGVIPNCSAVDENGIDQYPSGNYSVVGTYNLSCNPGYANVSVSCIWPLKYLKYEKDFHCMPPCPTRFRTQHDINLMKIIVSAFAVPTFIVDVFCIIIYALTPSRRTWPAIIPGYLFLTSCIAAVGFIIGVAGGFEKIWCEGNDFGQQSTKISASCFVSAALFVIGIESFVLWWIWQVIIITEMVTFPTLIPTLWQKILAHCTAFGLPVLVVIVAAATNNIGYPGDSPVCLFKFNGISDYVFWYPITVVTYCVVPLLIIAVIRLWMTGGKHALQLQWRLLLVILYSVATYACLSAFHLNLVTKKDAYRQAFITYLTCITLGETNCKLSKRPSLALQLTFFVLWELTGILYAMICGVDRDVKPLIRRFRESSSFREFLRSSWIGNTSTTNGSQNTPEQSHSHLQSTYSANEQEMSTSNT